MSVLEKVAASDVQEPTPVKLTIEDLLHLHEAGAFHKYAKTELIGGDDCRDEFAVQHACPGQEPSL